MVILYLKVAAAGPPSSANREELVALKATFTRGNGRILPGWKFPSLGVLFPRNHLNCTKKLDALPFKFPCEGSENIEVNEESGQIFQPAENSSDALWM